MLLGTLALTLSTTLAACGGEEDAPQVLSDTDHNEQDVAFASDMVQHHAQALTMVDLTLGRELDPEVHAMAIQIRDAQGPEIELMTDWLVDWDEEVPETVRDHANAEHGETTVDEHGHEVPSDEGGHEGHDMDDMGGDTGHDMPGMLSDDELTALEEATDEEFGDLWLELMIAHHEGAVEMAEVQLDEGEFRPAVELADDIIEAQEAEIEEMRALLG